MIRSMTLALALVAPLASASGICRAGSCIGWTISLLAQANSPPPAPPPPPLDAQPPVPPSPPFVPTASASARLLDERKWLLEDRPGLGFPITLLCLAPLALAVGVAATVFATNLPDGWTTQGPAMALGYGVGATLIAIGAVYLGFRIPARTRIDRRVGEIDRDLRSSGFRAGESEHDK